MNILLAQLLALRAQLDATIAIVESGELPAAAPAEPDTGADGHVHRWVDASTFGSGPQIECVVCHEKRPGTL